MKTKRINWKPSWRIISTRFPPINIYEQVADKDELEAIKIIESLTNPRINELIHKVEALTQEEQIYGIQGADFIMASYCYSSDGRFSKKEHLRAVYVAKKLKTAIEETKYHTVQRFLNARINEAEEDVRILALNLSGELIDIRHLQDEHPELYDPNNYDASEAFALRNQNQNGILYSSVRHAKGECAAVFKPKLFKDCETVGFLKYIYRNGTIEKILKIDELR